MPTPEQLREMMAGKSRMLELISSYQDAVAEPSNDPEGTAKIGWDRETATITIHLDRKTDRVILTQQQANDFADAIERANLEMRGIEIGRKVAGFDYGSGGPCRYKSDFHGGG